MEKNKRKQEERSEEQKPVYIKIANFDEPTNEVVNDAIEISGSTKCENINLVHILLALLNNTEFGYKLLDLADTSYEEVYNYYINEVENGHYGNFDSANVPFDFKFFSNDVMALLSEAASRSAFQGKQTTTQSLFEILLSNNTDYLREFMEAIGITDEVVNDAIYGEFFIPEPLEDFVEDLNTTVKKSPQTIKNVDQYIDEMIEILNRKLKANPCLVGEAGVGKTTIVKGLVQRILSGNVPNNLKNTHIVYINGALLTSGTRFRGDFEQRMQILIDWASKVDVIIFLDEIQTFINSGGAGSADTAGNMIKTSLADGSIKIIGTTTLKEYHKFIEKDTAFDRRLQKLEIKEPSIENAIDMIKDSIIDYEEFHNVEVPYNVIESTVKLSDRYMKNKFLPDKAYTILDQACAKVKLSHRNKVEESDILNVISKIATININKLGDNERKQILSLEDTIKKNVIGQKNAIESVVKAIKRSKAGVREPNKPMASFMFVGPTGVGKTELCKVLSNELAMGDASLIKIDMSEYSEKHSISKLIGTAPGYVGYEEGGQLTEKIKHNPYSVILFDEIEKAHPEVFNVFLQLLDEGRLTDGEGEKVDFTNCIIVMTSNAGYGAEGMNKLKLGFNSEAVKLSSNESEKIARKALKETFKPEFINRIDNIVIFDKLTIENCKSVTRLLLNKLSNRLKDQDININFTDELVNMIVENGYSEEYGARNLRREIQDNVEDMIADQILSKQLKEGCKVTMTYNNNKIEILSD